ncbi:MAG: KH domain-containing protein [Candidatus Levybacteria bacterium]|nr:KH domain-containing protein [Candidatus Levybacteria bacterium]MBP9815320.1 KH domain-containing protein [Candidatus Levybacteria bacterium]
MQDLLTYILDSIIEGEYTITEEEDNGFIVYKISPPQDQIGRIIGKNGKTIHAIKTLLKVRAVRENVKIDIQIAE